MMLDIKPNFEMAEQFLEVLSRKKAEEFTFLTFADDKAMPESNRLTRAFFGTLSEHSEELLELNRQGAGVFVTANRTSGVSRKVDDIISTRACFVDSDSGNLPPSLPLAPTLRIQTARGEHAYWCFNIEQPKAIFSELQIRLIENLGTDRTIKDPSRVMRIPGFFHLKNPKAPFLIRISSVSNRYYEPSEIRTAFHEGTHKAGSQSSSADFMSWIFSLSTASSHENPLGGRSSALVLIVRHGLALGLTEEDILAGAYEYCDRSGKERSYADEILKSQSTAHKKKPFEKLRNANSTHVPADLADKFLREAGYKTDSGLRLRYWSGEYFEYTGTHYRKMPYGDLKAEVSLWLQRGLDTRLKAAPRLINDVISNLEGICFIPSHLEAPVWIDKRQSGKNLISMKGAILDLEALLDGSPDPTLPHSPNFFCLSSLPYEYDPTAECPTWIKFLEEILPDPEIRNYLQEWFGLNLLPDTSYEKFAIFEGEGGNGKSVCLSMLRSLVGEENTCSVGLEAFNPVRTFALASTLGKLSNIVEELNEIDKTAEGLLKAFVSGNPMSVERKHRDPFQFRPSARTTFATNTLPRFTDKSDGLWRRLILIPFRFQVLDESKQNKNLISAKFWRESGELPGVLNWALVGLFRLRKRGRFEEPKSCRIAKDDFRKDVNPSRVFLLDHCEYIEGTKTVSRHLYSAYREYMNSTGHHSLAEPQLAKEVRRVFPKVELTKHAQRQVGGKRCREWINLQFMP